MNKRSERERGTYRPSIIERFWSYVDTSGGPDDCWPWTGWTDSRSGYGRFRADTIGLLPHRWLLGMIRSEPLAWTSAHHEMACHHCDNPPCCNPRHLYVGDQFKNMRDCVDRGRHAEAAQTHCTSGHPLSGENLYVNAASGQRCCRECRRRWSAEHVQRIRA